MSSNSSCIFADISKCIECPPLQTCNCFKTLNNGTHDESKYKTLGNTRIYILISIGVLSLFINAVIIIALIKSWKKLMQKSIYIFAISISVCDAILALVNVTNGGNHLWHFYHNSASAHLLLEETRWFYSIHVSIFLATELSSAGHTALIAMAFHRFVCAQLNKDVAEISSGPLKFMKSKGPRSVLLSKKTTLCLSLVVWILATAIFIIGLLWNCSADCECLIEKGSFSENLSTANCFRSHACSFLFEPIKRIYGLICGILFFIALAIIIFYGVQTIRRSGAGIASVLPYRLHLLWIKKEANQKSNAKTTPFRNQRQRIGNSLQLSYHRHLTHFIFYVMLIYVICRFPANLILVVDSLYEGPTAVEVKVVDILSILAFSYSLFNPIVYFFCLHHTKQAVFDLVDFCCFTKVEVKQTKLNCNLTVEEKSATLKQAAKGHPKSSVSFSSKVVVEAKVNQL